MKPIAVIDAYQYGSASQGHLILNGVFTASHFSISSSFIERPKGDENEFLEILNLPLSKKPNYPLDRFNARSEFTSKKKVVLIMIYGFI